MIRNAYTTYGEYIVLIKYRVINCDPMLQTSWQRRSCGRQIRGSIVRISPRYAAVNIRATAVPHLRYDFVANCLIYYCSHLRDNLASIDICPTASQDQWDVNPTGHQSGVQYADAKSRWTPV